MIVCVAGSVTWSMATDLSLNGIGRRGAPFTSTHRAILPGCWNVRSVAKRRWGVMLRPDRSNQTLAEQASSSRLIEKQKSSSCASSFNMHDVVRERAEKKAKPHIRRHSQCPGAIRCPTDTVGTPASTHPDRSSLGLGGQCGSTSSIHGVLTQGRGASHRRIVSRSTSRHCWGQASPPAAASPVPWRGRRSGMGRSLGKTLDKRYVSSLVCWLIGSS